MSANGPESNDTNAIVDLDTGFRVGEMFGRQQALLTAMQAARRLRLRRPRRYCSSAESKAEARAALEELEIELRDQLINELKG